ncbi:MAG: MaoC family dehydratase N-terminal domain-containing protein [Myxococcales bacterium]|nr:MaoC family dehydratase N-terminal domain-containing protein [Myxococcales bacterium]
MQLNLNAVGQVITTPPFAYDWRDCVLYALGVGAGLDDLDLVHEARQSFQVVPSFAVLPTMPVAMQALSAVKADFARLVHGEQRMRYHRPLPRRGTLHTKGRVAAVHDKGKGAVVLIESSTHDAHGDLCFDSTWSVFCRGQGGFGGERGEDTPLPDAVGDVALDATLPTRPEQALLYRLSGDLNPLHIDPGLATAVGFKAPILHGLCTYGFATRAVVRHLCGGDPARLLRFDARFSREVYPGETLRVQARPTAEANVFRLDVAVGEREVLSHGIVVVHPAEAT